MRKSLISSLVLAAAALLVVAGILVVIAGSPSASASTINLGPFLQNATTSAAVAVTSSTRLLATTTNTVGDGNSHTRIYATICNPSSNLVYVSLNQDAAASATSATWIIGAAAGYSACYQIDDRNPYNGSVTASSTNQTSTAVLVTQYVN